MKSKTVIITGASTGIGKAITAIFLERGSKVVMNSSNQQNLKQAYEDLGSPEEAVYLAGDISKRETAAQLVELAKSKFGSVDVLINNAGVFAPKPFLEVNDQDLDRFWGVNLKGTYYASQAVVPEMLAQKGGHIINIGTVLVDHAIAGFPATRHCENVRS